MRFAFERESDWPTVITVAEDGERAIYLLKQGLDANQKPDFVILDLNLPKRDGMEVLQWIRNTDRLQDIPVAIVSSSPLDVIQSQLNGAAVEANCYFVKPMEVDVFFGLTKKLHFCYKKAQRLKSTTG
jgi:DNA-binding response OmpR family regulator